MVDDIEYYSWQLRCEYCEMVDAAQPCGQRFIRSVHGPYLRACLGDLHLRYWYVEMAPACQNTRDHHWCIEYRGDKIVLRPSCSPAKYLRANPDGLVDLADKALKWETWTLVKNDNNTWSFLSHHGTWLRAKHSGVLYLQSHCNADECDPDEQFTIGGY